MKLFYLKDELEEKTKQILKDFSYSDKYIYKHFVYSDNDFNLLDLIDKCLLNNPSSKPLFSKNNKFVQNVIMAQIFKERIKNIEEMEYIDYLKMFEREDLKHGVQLKDIMTGYYVISLFAYDFINIDWKKYKFNSAEEMYYSLGVYICNISNIEDSREVVVNHKNKDIVSFYDNHIHGDFRYFQYDISNREMVNPIYNNETLPFGYPKMIGSLYGYHSVEHIFLIQLLSLAYKNKIKLPIIDNFQYFYNELEEDGQVFGNYADAGQYSSSMSLCAFAGFEDGYMLSLPIEVSGYYKSDIQNDEIHFLHSETDKDCVQISTSMINELIEGLFKKVQKGNGRSSISELTDCVLFFKDKHYNY